MLYLTKQLFILLLKYSTSDELNFRECETCKFTFLQGLVKLNSPVSPGQTKTTQPIVSFPRILIGFECGKPRISSLINKQMGVNLRQYN